MAKVYLIKLRTKKRLGDLIRQLEPLGEVMGFRETGKDNDPAPRRLTNSVNATNSPELPLTATPKPRQQTSEELREARRANMLATVKARKELVHPVLLKILQQNQYAMAGTIAQLLNQTEVRPLRDGPWKPTNVGAYIEYTLAKMTEPQVTNAHASDPA